MSSTQPQPQPKPQPLDNWEMAIKAYCVLYGLEGQEGRNRFYMQEFSDQYKWLQVVHAVAQMSVESFWQSLQKQWAQALWGEHDDT